MLCPKESILTCCYCLSSVGNRFQRVLQVDDTIDALLRMIETRVCWNLNKGGDQVFDIVERFE